MIKKENLIRRDFYLNLLDAYTNSIGKGKKSIAILGPRQSGKTSLLKEHAKNSRNAIHVYVDLERISLNPENFSIELVGIIAFNFLKKPSVDYQKFLTLEHLLKLEGELTKDSFSIIRSIESELLKIKPDQKLLVENAFSFAEALGKHAGKKFLMLLDNVESLLDLNNFPQIKDIISLIDFNSENVGYVASSSAIVLSLKSLKGFEFHELKNLEREESSRLVKSVIGDDTKTAEEIFSLTKGHMLITRLVAERCVQIKNAKKAFLIELLQRDNSVYHYCRNSLDYYYNRARGQTLLKAILKVVANDDLRLSEIARRVYRSAPVTKSILERLIEADILCKRGKKFYFTDEVLRAWVRLTSRGYEFEDIPDDRILDEASRQL